VELNLPKFTTSRRDFKANRNAIDYPQTAEGKKVHKVLIAEDVYYPGESETSEFYVSVLLNRATGRNMIMYSTEGGMDIEEVAEHTPHFLRKKLILLLDYKVFKQEELL
jgi:succinyl-CoA synthetase beta subunit